MNKSFFAAALVAVAAASCSNNQGEDVDATASVAYTVDAASLPWSGRVT